MHAKELRSTNASVFSPRIWDPKENPPIPLQRSISEIFWNFFGVGCNKASVELTKRQTSGSSSLFSKSKKVYLPSSRNFAFWTRNLWGGDRPTQLKDPSCDCSTMATILNLQPGVRSRIKRSMGVWETVSLLLVDIGFTAGRCRARTLNSLS